MILPRPKFEGVDSQGEPPLFYFPAKTIYSKMLIFVLCYNSFTNMPQIKIAKIIRLAILIIVLDMV